VKEIFPAAARWHALPPSGGLGHAQRPDREATQARAEAVGGQSVRDRVYDHRHTNEIERAENVAAGLPPEGLPREQPDQQPSAKKDFRQPHLETPAQVHEDKGFQPVHVQEQHKGLVESIKSAATNLVKKVQRLIKPVKKDP